MEENKRKIYDIGVVGAGAAGLTAVIYALRDNKNVILWEQDVDGGQAISSPRIDNIPGFYGVSGQSFINSMLEQIESILNDGFGNLSKEYTEVKIVNYAIIDGDRAYEIETDDGIYYAKKIIFATGNRSRHLNVHGEDELIGKGIHFCVTCDGPFYKDKEVVIVGGGNSALTEALELSKIAKLVTIVQDLPFLTGEMGLINSVRSSGNIRILTNTRVQKFREVLLETGAGLKVNRVAVDIKNVEYDDNDTLLCDGVFEAIGLEPYNECAKNVCKINSSGYITETQHNGVFFAGDCRDKKHRQIVLACADGAEAAIEACKQLNRGI